jgi:hypothetical protein
MPIPASTKPKASPIRAAAHLVAREPPDHGSGNPSAVEREGRDQVEGQQQDVPEEQPAQRQQHRRDVNRSIELRCVHEAVGPDEREVNAQADEHEQERRERTCGRDLELLARSGCVASHLRHASEQEQVDPANLDPLASGDERMPQLVDDQRPEQHQHRYHRGGVRHGVRAAQGSPEEPGEPEDHQE